MKRILSILVVFAAMIAFSGCYWHARTPSVRVGLHRGYGWTPVTKCKWVYISPYKKVRKCRKVRVRAR